MNNNLLEHSMKRITEAKYVTKRDGNLEKCELGKIEQRLGYLCSDTEKEQISICSIAVDASQSIYDKITTIELDNIAAQICASRASKHYFYEILGGRILTTNLHKETLNTFSDKIKLIHASDKTFLKLSFVKFIKNNAHTIDGFMDYSRDLNFGYFAFMTLQKSYLIRVNDKLVERPQDIFMRVAVAIHCDDIIAIEDIMTNIKRSYDYMSLGYFTHATPTLFNAGLKSGNLASCFLLGTDDSITGQFKTLGDCAQISKWAGGIGIHVSNVRGKNSDINSTKGKTHGIVPMLKVFNETARYVNQSGRRNGSIAVYLEPWHSDILEFLDLRKPTGSEELRARDLFLALWIPDRFMTAMENKENWYLMSPDECPGLTDVYGEEFNKLYQSYVDQKKYREVIPAETVWKKILESQFETGVPYIAYKDTINKNSNQKNIGVVKSSNLCVAPETKILTDKGYLEISKLKDQKINVWNGSEYSEIEVKQTGENQKLIKIITSDGNELQCTPYHKFHIQNSYSAKDISIIEAKELKPNMKLIKCDYPVIKTGLNTFKYPYTAGLFSAEGTYTTFPEIHRCNYKKKTDELYCMRHIDYKNYDNIDYHSITSDDDICCAKVGLDKPKMTLYHDKMSLLEYIDKRDECNVETSDKKLTVLLPLDIPRKYTVPIDQKMSIKLEWLAGFIDGDGTISVNGTNKQLQISSIDFKFLQNINHMLNTMGVNGKISIMSEEKSKLLPDGHGGHKEYLCQKSYRLLLSSCDLYKLHNLGLKCYRLKFDNLEEPQRDAKQFIKIDSIIDENRYDDTYCFNEPKKHMGIFNGIIAGNCAEITEVSSSSRYSVCNLASIAVNKYVDNNVYNYEKLHEITKQIVYNINRVIEITFYPTNECKKTNLSDRPMGIGIQGVADLFHIMKLSYASQEAVDLEQNILETIYHASLEASCELAVKYGKYELFEGSDLSKGIFHFEYYNTKPRIYSDWDDLKKKIKEHGVRNSLMIALMPTASTSQILGNTECFEPITSNIYTRRTSAGEFIIVNKYLIKELIDTNLWTEEMREQLIINDGSIQLIKGIPDDIKERYKTVWEIKMKDIINHAIYRQAYVDQSQSMNLFTPINDANKLTSALLYGWKNGLKTGMYYLRTLPASQAQKFSIDANKISVKEKPKPKVFEAEEACLNCSS
jgi:ribonucleoside-diphosphate reductase alpha chain